MLRPIKKFAAVTMVVACIASSVSGDVGVGAGTTLFQQGQTRLSLTAGYGSFNDNNYFVAGAGAGYYLLRGVEAGVDGEAWVGSNPHIYTVSPELRYIYLDWDQFKPYIGGFFKRTFYNTLPDINSVGGRAGIVTPLNTHAFISAGVVYEKYLSCDNNLYTSCSQVYPEIGISFAY